MPITIDKHDMKSQESSQKISLQIGIGRKVRKDGRDDFQNEKVPM